MKINFQNMCSLRKISCGLIFSMAISLVACGSDNDEEGGGNGDDGFHGAVGNKLSEGLL